MPIYEYECLDCGKTTEFLQVTSYDAPVCSSCGGNDMRKLLSAPSAASGLAGHKTPGAGDTGCCGSTPGQAQGCAGPGSCCGGRGR